MPLQGLPNPYRGGGPREPTQICQNPGREVGGKYFGQVPINFLTISSNDNKLVIVIVIVRVMVIVISAKSRIAKPGGFKIMKCGLRDR